MEKGSARTIAAQMLKHAHERDPKITEAVYYDGDDLFAIDLDEQTKGFQKTYNDEDRSKRVAFWDVAHTTGSDIPLSKNDAVAIAIVGRHLRLFELMQSAMRLRQLGSGQRLQICVKREDKAVMMQKLQRDLGVNSSTSEMSVEHVIQYGA